MNNHSHRSRRLKTKYTRRTNKNVKKILKKKGKNVFLSILLWIILGFIVISAILGVFLYNKYISDLPNVSELENLEIAESSIIYDRDGNELYKIFKEKRTYVQIDGINKNMINAIVAIEDKRYWTNPGVDIKGLVRAGINYIIGKSGGVKGTSTLTQQLIRNTIIKNEKSLERKIKEIYLAYKLTSSVSKEKILELYLNKISYGHNAFGIEEASKTFFSKSAKDIGILEASILASLPKGPTYYSPYNHPDRTVGYPYIYTSEHEDEAIKIISKKDKIINSEMLLEFTNFVTNLKASKLEGTSKILICNIKKENFKNAIRIDNDGCSVMEYSALIDLLNSVKIKKGNNYIEYETGRKDRVLGRMLEDGYINFEEYKSSIVNAIGYSFSQSRENIKAPHFVFYVKEYLEEKYGKEIVSIGGLKIYTTLDSNLQNKAEELITKQTAINADKFGATNAALISIDNKTGEILSMVGGRDYFDKENKGNVNIITSKLQPGSTFKPFVYSLGLLNNKIGTKSPIYDVKTNFPGGYSPSNFDGKFKGKMEVASALNNSRNIPAIKMYFLAGGEKIIVDFMKKLGVKSLNNKGQYGAPLALGTGEMTPLELASAYTVFANMGIKRKIIPILKITDSKGNIIEEKKKTTNKQTVIPTSQAYTINSILSDTSTRPTYWNKFLSLSRRKVSAKTGTSTKQYKKNGVKIIYPSNLWTIGYTPQITTVVWAGNTDGTRLNTKGNGLEGAGPIWKGFMEYAHKGRNAENWKRPSGVKEVYISLISGLLPTAETKNNGQVIKSLFINVPNKYDNSYKSVQVDTMCNGAVTEKTPKLAINNVTLISFNSLLPNNSSWQIPVKIWAKGIINSGKYGDSKNIITSIGPECKRSGVESKIDIRTTTKNNSIMSAGTNYVEFAYKSSNPIIKIDILIDDKIVDEVIVDNKKTGSYVGNIFIPASKSGKKAKLTLRAVDTQYFSSNVNRNINIIREDIVPPKINILNPKNGIIKIYSDDFFNLKAIIEDSSSLKNVIIKVDGEIIQTGNTDRNITFPVNKGKKLNIGNHRVDIEAIDKNFNKSSKKISVEILER